MAPDEDAPAPPGVQDEVVVPAEDVEPSPEGRRLAGSPQAAAANAALLALTRAARSFTLYDPANKVVRALIGDYREKLQKALASFGSLVLEVHPFELVLGREVVYLEKDRERSLSFRLFRDGVRRIGLEPGMTWVEMLRLLQILSIRYTGVRQQEEDLVTLLRKAGFDHVSVSAIEGFVPEEEFAEPPIGDLLRGATRRHEAPARWDLPLPPFPEAVPLRYRPVGAELLERLRNEEAEEAVPKEAVRAVAELLHAPGLTDLETVLAFALEVREFLLVEQRVEQVAELGRIVRQALEATPEATPEAAAGFFGSFLDARTLQALVTGLCPDSEEIPAPLLELLDAAPAASLDRLVDLLADEGRGPRAPLLRRLVVRSFRHAPEALVARLRESSGETSVALLHLLADVDAQAALHAAVEASTAGSDALQLEALRQLAGAAFNPETARALHHLATSRFEAVRVAALPVMASRGGARVFPALQAHAEKHAAGCSAAEAEALGGALAQAQGPAALALFASWLKPKAGGLLGRLVKMHAPPTLQRVALAGLRRAAGAEAEELLRLLAAHGEVSVAREAEAALHARGRAPGRPG
jgi:hypothetical protein